ncbi:DHA2 family efflux MFS transporter permease subunit [Arthrobacter sp. H5]|uniref:DHA2 family efflux MFS transporter permease subunit n=1 Tax=Arthrobacter sp. H5 TaxID=1267973 RepID=UPI0004887147|nr:DHA2 family efflux MFS transporter permease subunit [Arthrobacter sp. H5]
MDSGATATGIRFSSAAGRWILLASILGSGLAGIDATVVNVALPAIGADLGADFATLQWTVTSYTLTLASFILLGGSLGDRFGRRRIFVIGVIWFAVASLLCGIAPNAEVLIAARTLQGVGGALLTPGSLAMIQASFMPDDRARAIGAWSGLGGVATAIGPFLGGWLVQFASWRWVFLINVPLALAVVVISHRHVPESRGRANSGRLDIPGAVLGAVALAGVTYALIEAPAMGLASWPVLVTAAIGIAASVAFVVVERRSRNPMLPLGIFRSAQFSATNAVTFVIYGAFGVILFLLVVHLQVVSGFTPIASGTALLPVTILMLLLSARAGALAARIGPRIPMSVGPAICAVGLALMLRIGEDASYVFDVLPGVIVLGLGLSLLVAPLTATALATVDDEHAGLASGVNNAVARAAALIAIAVIPAAAGLTGEVYTNPGAFAEGFRTAVLIAVVALVAGALLAALTIRNVNLTTDDDGGVPEGEAVPEGAAHRARGEASLRHCAVDGPPIGTGAAHEAYAAEGGGSPRTR